MIIYPRQLAERFSPASLRRQFVLARDARYVPAPWTVDVVDGWHLGTNDLPAVRLLGTDGEPAGWLIGHAIDLERGLIQSEANAADVLGQFDALAGRFVLVLAKGPQPRVYLDAGGMLPLVYDPRQEILASSLMLIPYTDDTPDDDELIDLIGIPERNGYFPFGLTPRKQVFRLLPNFVLDLSQWTAKRHWPGATIPPVAPEGAVAEIVDIMQRTIAALSAAGPVHAQLTAGRDSRCVLACGKGVVRTMRFHTADLPRPDPWATVDLDVAPRVARQFQLDYRVLPHVAPTADELHGALYETGCAVGEQRGWRNVATMRQLAGKGALITGHGAEVGKAYFWRPRDDQADSLGPERLVERLHLRRHTRLTAAAATWLASVPDGRWLALDLAYIEQRLGCWGGVHSHWNHVLEGPLVAPFSHRTIYALELALPMQYKTEMRLSDDILRRTWPELLEFPFNEPVSARLKLVAATARQFRRIKRGVLRRLPATRKTNAPIGAISAPPPALPERESP